MLETLWQLGVFSAVLVFGVKIGLAMGFAGLTKKQMALITTINGICIIVLSKLCEPYVDLLYNSIYSYSSIIFGLMAVIILLTGIHTVHDWKQTHKNHATATSLALIVPCPCCIGAVVGSIIVVAPIVSISSVFLGTISATLLMILIVVFYLLSDTVVKKINRPYPIVLGNFMIFVGLYFLIAMTILPTLSRVLTEDYEGFAVSIPYNLIMVAIVMGIIIAISILYKRKTQYSNEL
ncbi:MAG: hypothetical protein BZ136_04650 [Methanosphaera sp. rholeuAM74]|nr:MAG: hypothetical protein BZ136_04650 [Methanosphaera sp. rholeuAM74]